MDKIVFFQRIAAKRKQCRKQCLLVAVRLLAVVFVFTAVSPKVFAESKVMTHLKEPHPAVMASQDLNDGSMEMAVSPASGDADAHGASHSMADSVGAEKMPADSAMKHGEATKESSHTEASHAHDATDDIFQEAKQGESAHEGHKSATEAIVQNELEEVGIKEKVGTYVNGNLKFTDHTGRQVALGEFFDGKPVVLSFMYYTCPSICQYVIDAQKQAMSKMGMKMGEDFRAVTVSFDEKDNPELGSAIYERYSSGFSSAEGQRVDWNFLTGDKSAIDQITSQLGFQFKWVEQSGEFAHTAAIYVISPDKKISRYFYGLNFSPFDLKLALAEAKEEKVRSTMERVLLYCYRYDEHERGFVADAWKIMRIGGAFTAGSIAVFLILMIRMERGRRDDVVALEGEDDKKNT